MFVLEGCLFNIVSEGWVVIQGWVLIEIHFKMTRDMIVGKPLFHNLLSIKEINSTFCVYFRISL